MLNLKISLAAARVNARLTQSELAVVLGVHKTTIHNWENGKTSPNYTQLQKIGELSGIPIDYIFLPDTLLKVDKESTA